MKLNLGCGLNDLREGYINVDQRPFPEMFPPPKNIQFLLLDLSAIPWPFRDNGASEILMLDILEHFPIAKTGTLLRECWRVLEPDGELVVQVPDATEVMRSIVQDRQFMCTCRQLVDGGGGRFPCKRCGRTTMRIACDARDRLFGGQDYSGNFHETCFTEAMLKWELSIANFKLLSDENDLAGDHWNIRFRFKKVS